MDQLAHLVVFVLVTVISVSIAETHHEMNDDKDSNHQMADSVEQLNEGNAMKDEVNALKAANMKVMEGFAKLLGQVDLLKAENFALRTDNTNIIKKMDVMEADMNALKAENYELRAEFTKVINEMGATKAEMSSLVDRKINNHANSISTVPFKRMKSKDDLDIDNSGRVQTNFVAFTAYPSVDGYYQIGQKILFNATHRNYGGYYDPNRSRFVCPITAYYIFSVSMSTGGSSNIHAVIQIGGEGLSIAVGSDSSWPDQGSNSVVTLCESGQIVSVYMVCCTGTNRMTGGSVTTFTGVLLQIA